MTVAFKAPINAKFHSAAEVRPARVSQSLTSNRFKGETFKTHLLETLSRLFSRRFGFSKSEVELWQQYFWEKPPGNSNEHYRLHINDLSLWPDLQARIHGERLEGIERLAQFGPTPKSTGRLNNSWWFSSSSDSWKNLMFCKPQNAGRCLVISSWR